MKLNLTAVFHLVSVTWFTLSCGGGGGGGGGESPTGATTTTSQTGTDIKNPGHTTNNTETQNNPTQSDKPCGEISDGLSAERLRYATDWAVSGTECSSEIQKALCSNGVVGKFSGSFTFEKCFALADYCSSIGGANWQNYDDSTAMGMDGTAAKPFKICTATQLRDLGKKCAGADHDGKACGLHFLLMKDIELGNIPLSRGDLIGDAPHPFSGSFDGNGLAVNGIEIDLTNELPIPGAVGLFAHTGGSAVIRNLKISGAVKGIQYVGLLVGFNNGTVDGITASGTVHGKSQFHLESGYSVNAWGIGGVVGKSYGDIKNTSSSVAVDGAVGTNTYALFSRYVGGIVGQAQDSEFSNLTFTGAVHGCLEVGGIAGQLENSSLSKSESRGSVSGCNQVGGLIGTARTFPYTNLTIPPVLLKEVVFMGSFVQSDKWTTASNVVRIGGILGDGFRIHMDNASNQTVINLSGSGSVGGLAGRLDEGIIENSTNSAAVSAGGAVGGLVGSAKGLEVKNSSNKGNITAPGQNVGGILGESELGGGEKFFRVSSEADISGSWKVGGLVGGGSVSFKIAGCFAKGNITGINFVGGLVGSSQCQVCSVASIRQSYFEGKVTASEDFVGALAGSSGSVSESFANAEVTGRKYVGGLVGQTTFGITDSFFRGTVAATSGTLLGGLLGLGEQSFSVNDSYYSLDSVAISSPSNTLGLKTTKADLVTSATANWDLDSAWVINPAVNDGWPALKVFEGP